MVELKNLSWYSDPRSWLRAMLMLDDSSHRIALGGAIGVFIGLTPTIGIQMLLVLLLAVATRSWFHFNKVAALLMVYVSNPLTALPIYWFNYNVGTIYFPHSTTRSEFEELLQYDGFMEWCASFTRLFVDVGVPLVVGSLVVATCFGLATYPILLRVIRNLRRAERQALAAQKQARKRRRQTQEDADAGCPIETTGASAQDSARLLVRSQLAASTGGVEQRSPV
jgi:uncharacterized protein